MKNYRKQKYDKAKMNEKRSLMLIQKDISILSFSSDISVT